MNNSLWSELQNLGRKHEERFLMLSESLPLGVFVVDLSGACQYTNRCWQEIAGLAFDPSTPLCWDEALHPDDRAKAYQSWLEAVPMLKSFEGTYRLGDGLSQHPFAGRWGEIRLSPAISDWGVTYVGVLEEITDRIRARERQEQYSLDLLLAKEKLEENAEQLNWMVENLTAAKMKAEVGTRAKSEFLANMSHEIRTPMTAILGYTDLLLEQTKDDPQIGEYLETIKRNGLFLLEIINDILDLSKIEAGKLMIETIPCSLVSVVNDVMGLMQVRAKSRQLGLTLMYHGVVPETIHSDPTRLRQILINLLNNAIKFTSSGSVQLIVAAADDQTAGQLSPGEWPAGNPRTDAPACILFDVVDSGIGMSAEQQERLFQPFTQADTSTTRKYGGTGLGLTISRRLAQVLNGDITMKSQPGVGSTFRLQIDAGSLRGVKWIDPAVPTAATNPQAAQPLHADASTAPLAGYEVLLVEDGQDNQRLISFILKKAGAEVACAENGQLALDAVLSSASAERTFDIILMDMQMPVMDGYTATRQLREQGIATPIIALTAHAMEGDRQKCLAAGCTDYAPKPINKAELIAKIQQCVEATGVSL
ncbi:MAG: response regulator [Planctomycetaceae bacterium]